MVVVIVAIASLVAVACADDESEPVDPTQGIELGSGERPDTVPADFPIPDVGVISSTLVNRNTGSTEMIVRLPVAMPVAVEFYNQNLPPAGYEIISSEGRSDTGWDMSLAGPGLTADIDFRVVGPEITQAIFTFQEE